MISIGKNARSHEAMSTAAERLFAGPSTSDYSSDVIGVRLVDHLILGESGSWVSLMGSGGHADR